ncbi:MAG: response regulator [Beggiatoa sp.]|nr:response regulator [Beggiatoa sp.]
MEVATLVARAIETAEPLFDARGQRLKVSMPEGRLIVDGDLTRLSQIVSNILNNAAKYTPDSGQISLQIETASRDGGSAEEVLIRVKDNGTGIPPEMLPEVFDLFTQVDQALDRSHGGLGIGLALVRKLVEMHGGSIEAHSDGVGHGSEFFVRLPCRNERVDVKGATASADDAIKTPVIRRRVLVVDDNEDSAETLALALQLEGYDVETAHGGQQALELAERFLPEMVLLDIGMPGIDGYEVARSIRAQPWGADMLLVAQTGWGQEEDRRRTREAGFDAHMTKPLDHSRLMSLMAQWPMPSQPAGIATG